MRVKRLEIQGFKSFKDKTVVHFDHSITGIVGPNGCGKSNIVDSFFWVMGEQSNKHMRASASADLIFNGSSKYAPLGVAEATLVLETDAVDTATAPAGASSQDLPMHLKHKEISITRRVYRDGQGEYFMNGVPSRLRDIREFFMDTGVGAKGYSVIEQGQIGRVVNAKPEDRRLLIEEAAGIAKYKARKKESLRKMQVAQANLERLQDITSELERRLASLERQAQRAKRYQEYKAELLQKEMTWGRRKYGLLKRRLDEIESERAQFQAEVEGSRAELLTLENELEANRVAQVSSTKEVEDLQVQVQEQRHQLTQEQSALELSRQRQRDLEIKAERLLEERAQIERAVEDERQELKSREEEYEQAKVEFDSSAERVLKLMEESQQLRTVADEFRTQIEDARKELMEGTRRASDQQAEAASLEGQLESLQGTLQELEAEATQLVERTEDAQNTLQESQNHTEVARAQTQEAEAQRSETKSRRKELESKVKELEKELRQSHQETTRVQSRLESLEELEKNHEGLESGPKAALRWAHEAGHEATVLADLLEVEAGLEVAAQAWLGSRLQHVVCDSVESSLGALERLWQEQGGLAQFEVLGHQSVTPDDFGSNSEVCGFNDFLKQQGFVVRDGLDVLVRPKNDRFGATLACLTQNVCVVEKIDPSLVQACREQLIRWDSWALVDLEGTVLEIGDYGSLRLRGGRGEGQGLLDRKRAMEELRVELSSAQASEERATEVLAQARQELEQAQEQETQTQEQLSELKVSQAQREKELSQAEKSLREVQSQKEKTQRRLEEAQSRKERFQTQKEDLLEAHGSWGNRRIELESFLENNTSDLEAKDSQAKELEGQLQEERLKEASSKEKITSLSRELENARNFIEGRQKRFQEILDGVEQAEKDRATLSESDQGLRERIEGLVSNLSERERNLAERKDALGGVGAKINAHLERIRTLREEVDGKNGKLNDLNVEQERARADLENLVQNLEEKYGPGCLEQTEEVPIQEEMDEPVVTAEMSAEEEKVLAEEVEVLRNKIRRLGEVNTMAVEEYEELKVRFDSLDDERQDLERSIEDLQEAIDHINKTSEERFHKAFEAIANRFEKLFPVIFGGGRAQLSLVYPEAAPAEGAEGQQGEPDSGANARKKNTDILDCGVDILAQPPGKKIVNIGLLSGGEKALTALSLIFAIFMVKPSPFCILDEVDAPLDDTNIGKFNALLREMSTNTQFILITHNKKTMELNDTLYGVTMEEPGVSKMVSIELQ